MSDGKQNKIFVHNRVPSDKELKEDEPVYIQAKDGGFYHSIKHKGKVHTIKMESVPISNVKNYYNNVINIENAVNPQNEVGISGTWTPAVTGASSATLTTATGEFVKVGRLVIASFYIVVTSPVSATQFQLNGLPYIEISSTFIAGTGSSIWCNIAYGLKAEPSVYDGGGVVSPVIRFQDPLTSITHMSDSNMVGNTNGFVWYYTESQTE